MKETDIGEIMGKARDSMQDRILHDRAESLKRRVHASTILEVNEHNTAIVSRGLAEALDAVADAVGDSVYSEGTERDGPI